MIFALRSAAIGFALVVLPVLPARADERAPACPARWNKPGKPLVTNSETAKAIFLAVEKDFFPAADAETYPVVGATDEGDRWIVSRGRSPVTTPQGDVEVTMGGGQLALTIAKCDAAISGVVFNR